MFNGIFFLELSKLSTKGEPGAAELGANTDANHTCTNLF